MSELFHVWNKWNQKYSIQLKDLGFLTKGLCKQALNLESDFIIIGNPLNWIFALENSSKSCSKGTVLKGIIIPKKTVGANDWIRHNSRAQ